MRFLLLLTAATLASAQTEVSSLGWLAGCWEMRPAPGILIEEHWTKPAGGTLLGMGRTIKGSRTVFTEFFRISIENGKLTYTARIGTKGVTEFPLLKMSTAEITFENPTHDFPQRVIYRKNGENITARIEGMDKGKERHEDFPYTRAKCE
ncbi:MAG: DUF6265 family protein [Acidobacteriota bacterium]